MRFFARVGVAIEGGSGFRVEVPRVAVAPLGGDDFLSYLIGFEVIGEAINHQFSVAGVDCEFCSVLSGILAFPVYWHLKVCRDLNLMWALRGEIAGGSPEVGGRGLGL